MKRITVFAIAMLIVLSACGETNEPPVADSASPPSVSGTESPAQDTGEKTPAPVTKKPPESPAAADGAVSDYPLSDALVVDNEICVFMVKSVTEIADRGFTLKVLCENKTDKVLEFTWNDVSVNGYMLDPYWYSQVAAGKKSNTEITFSYEQLERCGITTVYDIEFMLRAYDSMDWYAGDLVCEEYVIYPTGDDSFVYPERVPVIGEYIAANNNDILFIVEEILYDSDWGGYTLNCYIENKSTKSLEFIWDNVSVNGFMVDTYLYVNVSAGKRACTEISITEYDLELNDITDIEEIEFLLSANTADDWYAPPVFNEIITYKLQNNTAV